MLIDDTDNFLLMDFFNNTEGLIKYAKCLSLLYYDFYFIFDFRSCEVKYISTDFTNIFSTEYRINWIKRILQANRDLLDNVKSHLSMYDPADNIFELRTYFPLVEDNVKCSMILSFLIGMTKTEGLQSNILCTSRISKFHNQERYSILRSIDNNQVLHYQKPEFVEKKETDINNLLTARERQLLFLMVKGFDNKEIACMLNLSYSSVRKYKEHIYVKLNVHSNSEVRNFFYFHNII